MRERKTIVIIGAGVSGLSAGIYAMQNGFNAVILEKNPNVGGLCTGWTRRGFEIDGCIHWLTGTNKNNCLYDMWKNVGAFSSDEDIYQPASWGSFEYEGTTVTLWCDLDRAEKEWCEISPIDSKQIKKFFNLVRKIGSVQLPLQAPISMLSPKHILKLGFSVLKVLPSFIGSMLKSCESFAKKFKHPALKYTICHAQPGPGNLYSMLYSYATVVNGDGGVPYGGAKFMTLRMAQKFIDLGGVLKTNCPVRNILTKNGKSVGVKLSNGGKVYGDYVVSCADAGFTLKKLLLNQYRVPSFDKKLANPSKYSCPSCCFISLAIEDIPNFESPLNFKMNEKILVGAREIDTINMRSYVFDKTFVKDNKSVVTILIDQYADDFDVWNEIYKRDISLYNLKKQKLAELVISKIVEHFPSLEGKITLLDVATPRTYTNYCNSTKGAYMSFSFNEKTGCFNHSGKIPGLKNFYLGSQWVQGPGGLPLALAGGKFAIQRICKKENIAFMLSTKKPKTKKVINKI